MHASIQVADCLAPTFSLAVMLRILLLTLTITYVFAVSCPLFVRVVATRIFAVVYPQDNHKTSLQVPIVNDEPESDVEISAGELAKLTGPQAYTCTGTTPPRSRFRRAPIRLVPAMRSVCSAVDKTKEAAASILEAVEGDAAAAMKSWDTQGDLDGEPIENDDGSLTLKCRPYAALAAPFACAMGTRIFLVSHMGGTDD